MVEGTAESSALHLICFVQPKFQSRLQPLHRIVIFLHLFAPSTASSVSKAQQIERNQITTSRDGHDLKHHHHHVSSARSLSLIFALARHVPQHHHQLGAPPPSPQDRAARAAARVRRAPNRAPIPRGRRHPRAARGRQRGARGRSPDAAPRQGGG
ncbi:hypothetical protein BKA81DRAFT_26112 [Phyllosticta paracitricarpa]